MHGDGQAAGTYLVERYCPGVTRESLFQALSGVSRAAAEMQQSGKAVRLIRSTFFPEDEAVFCMFEADTPEAVREVNERAGFDFDRISRVEEVTVRTSTTPMSGNEPSGVGLGGQPGGDVR